MLWAKKDIEANVVYRIVATSTEAFIIRIYRQANKQGFLKAFSDSPEPFTTGFSPLANSMRNLFLRKTSLWPRFHVTVAESLEGQRKAEVIELEVPMSEKMREIQNAVMECVEISIGELKKANTGIDVEDWTLDSALHKSFDVAIRRQLDHIWHRVSFRTRQIVNDLTDLRAILQCVGAPYYIVIFHVLTQAVLCLLTMLCRLSNTWIPSLPPILRLPAQLDTTSRHGSSSMRPMFCFRRPDREYTKARSAVRWSRRRVHSLRRFSRY